MARTVTLRATSKHPKLKEGEIYEAPGNQAMVDLYKRHAVGYRPRTQEFAQASAPKQQQPQHQPEQPQVRTPHIETAGMSADDDDTDPPIHLGTDESEQPPRKRRRYNRRDMRPTE